MKWLREFHRQWMLARRSHVDGHVRAFRRDWDDLLDAAGTKSAEDRATALREAERLPQVRLVPVKGKPRIVSKIELPVESESWLHEHFGTQSGGDAQTQALRVVAKWSERQHPLIPELWSALCNQAAEAFEQPLVLGPLRWREPQRTDDLLALTFHITAREWPEGTLIRAASEKLGFDSKHLESQQSSVERVLELLFCRQTPFEALGIQSANSVLHFSGPLTLHFPEGKVHESTALQFESSFSVAELERAQTITTTAERLLTVENRKTTFVQLARADRHRTTLVVATSFPTRAMRLFLAKLSTPIPCYHFGDTDPAGWDILRQLRTIARHSIAPFHMTWRDKPEALALTKNEKAIIRRLLADPTMADCQEHLQKAQSASTRGDFEQESLGAPVLEGWPFF